jgi:hypothetical protein
MFGSWLRSRMAVTLAMLATRVLKPRLLTAANSGSSSRCIDCLRSLALLVVGVGRDLIFGDRFKVDDRKIPIVLAFFRH